MTMTLDTLKPSTMIPLVCAYRSSALATKAAFCTCRGQERGGTSTSRDSFQLQRSYKMFGCSVFVLDDDANPLLYRQCRNVNLQKNPGEGCSRKGASARFQYPRDATSIWNGRNHRHCCNFLSFACPALHYGGSRCLIATVSCLD
ncbi:hypothetical protein M758_UG001200 [Ceratodon purpureus]|nr:hypothetical protein M758_UG001200 [Ceratodon purpureus]